MTGEGTRAGACGSTGQLARVFLRVRWLPSALSGKLLRKRRGCSLAKKATSVKDPAHRHGNFCIYGNIVLSWQNSYLTACLDKATFS